MFLLIICFNAITHYHYNILFLDFYYACWWQNCLYMNVKLMQLHYRWISHTIVRQWFDDKEYCQNYKHLENVALIFLITYIDDAKPIRTSHLSPVEDLNDINIFTNESTTSPY